MSPAPPRNVVHVKPGVDFTVIAPAGFRLLGAIELAARRAGVDLTITSACDGLHSGPDDPHHRGEAYDIRSHDLPELLKHTVLAEIMRACNDPGGGAALPATGIAGGLVTSTFFGFIEAVGTDNEHIHVQVRQGRPYP